MTLSFVCPKCGEAVEKKDFFGKVCRTCFENVNPEPLKIKMRSLSICKGCGKIYGRKWSQRSQLWDVLKNNLVCNFDNYFIVSNSYTEHFEKEQKFISIVIKYFYKYNGKKVIAKYEKDLPVRFINCPDCGKIRGNYYEAIIQVRYDGKTYNKRIEKAIANIIKAEESKDVIVIQSKIIQKKGYDLYITLKPIAKSIVKSLRSSFEPEYIGTYKLVGFDMAKGKRKYRATHMLRFKSEDPNPGSEAKDSIDSK